jgi:hypothetical protein
MRWAGMRDASDSGRRKREPDPRVTHHTMRDTTIPALARGGGAVYAPSQGWLYHRGGRRA